jgi:hypothetical protein
MKERSMTIQNEQNKPNEPEGTDIVGGAGNQHNDWGHSDVGGNQQSGNQQSGSEQSAGGEQTASRLDDVVGSDTGVPAEEAGELQTGMGGIGSLSTGNAGSRQSAGETQPGGERGAMQSGDKGNAQAPESGGQRTRQ